MPQNLSPIVLFTYNRPWHTEQTLDALSKNTLAGDSILYIYADGPKKNSSKEDLGKINETRNLVRKKQWCKEVHIIESEANKGLANSIIDGVTEIVNKYGRVIVLEDDLVTSNYFLKFMNDALSIYENEDKVISICGYMYPIKKMPELFFIKGADCWGWATWKRGWDLFEADGQKLLTELEEKKLAYDFDMLGSFSFTQMLKDQILQKNDSWAIRWYASAFLKNKLTLYPGSTLVNNIGHDGSGTHSSPSTIFNSTLTETPVKLVSINNEENTLALKQIGHFLNKAQQSLSTNENTSKFLLIKKKLNDFFQLLLLRFM